jgi:hypothetical protein
MILKIFLKKKQIMFPLLDNIKKLALLVFFILMTTMGYSYAYIDPGTGSFILQGIIALGASIFFYLGYPIRIVKSMFNKIFKKKKKIEFKKK